MDVLRESPTVAFCNLWALKYNMLTYQTSIRQKIIVGYYAAVAVIVGLSIFTFITLRFIEKKVVFGEVISELFDTTLEIRRFEKNFFLYEQESDYHENIEYVTKAQQILRGNMEEYKTLTVSRQLDTLSTDLTKYKELLEEFATLRKKNNERRTSLEEAIREKGKKITTIAEDILRIERERLQILLSQSRRNIVFSIIFLSLAGIAIGQALSRMVVKPLKSLEETLSGIADGRLETVSINSKDREIVSLTNAFNKMLKELELRQRHLVQSEKLASLGTLLSGVAHELNNPLSNISSSCQILTEEIADADLEFKKELLTQIDEQTDRAKNIVRSLLEFSRTKEFKKVILPLKNLFDETIRFVKGQIPTKVTINLDIAEDITVFADKQRLQQAFLNLVKNAIDAITEEGSVTVTAKRVHVEEIVDFEKSLPPECQNLLPPAGPQRDAVYIKISDTGKGIERSLLGKIFDPFFTTKDVGKGSGLGLSIVHEIIEEHDGCIGVASQVGKGTMFLIRLPSQFTTSGYTSFG